MLTLTSLHELEVDDLIDSTGMYLGAASVFAVSDTDAASLPRRSTTAVLFFSIFGCTVRF